MLREAQIREAIDVMVARGAAPLDHEGRRVYALRDVLGALADAGMLGAAEHLHAEDAALRASREAERVKHAVPNNRAGRRMLKKRGR